jgi:hypothetical protein
MNNIDDVVTILDMYKTDNNISVVSWIIDNRGSIISVMDCVNDTNVNRLTVHNIFRILSSKNILKEIDIYNDFNSFREKKDWLEKNGFSVHTKKAYVVDYEGISDYINKRKERIENKLGVFLM